MSGVALKLGTVVTLVGMAVGGTAAMYVGDANSKIYVDEKVERVRSEFNGELKNIKEDVKLNGKALTRIEAILVHRYGSSIDNP